MNLESLVVNIKRDNAAATWTARIDGMPELSGQGSHPDEALKRMWQKAVPVIVKQGSGLWDRGHIERLVKSDADYNRVVSIDHLVAEWKLPV